MENSETEIDIPAAADSSYLPESQLSFAEIKKLDEQYLLQNYSRMPVAFSYGSGEFLYDSEGKEYIDFLSGIAVTGLGHAHADLIAALTNQAELLWHTSNLFYNAQQAKLARALVEVTFPGKVFFCNSGTEANEAALKLMRAHGQNFHPEKTKVISLSGGFHGRTFGAMSMTGQEKIHTGFGPLVPGFTFVEPNDVDELIAVFNEKVCGIIIEPVIGEGGVLPMTQEYLDLARDLATKYNALLVMDEIQTGMGRSGHYFCFQHYGIEPDAITMAKGLGGGLPIGALLVAEKYATALTPGQHGSTFGGNHITTAVAYEVLRSIEYYNVLENVRKMNKVLTHGLEDLKEKFPDLIMSVRGIGLLLGIVLREDIEARKLIDKGLELGLVFGRAGNNVIRLAPPLIVRRVTIEKFLEKLGLLLSELQ